MELEFNNPLRILKNTWGHDWDKYERNLSTSLLTQSLLEQISRSRVPDSVFYVSNFITEEKERFLIDKVNQAPIPKWTILSNRRLQNWGGIPHPKGMIQENIPQWLQECNDLVSKKGVFEANNPNHILVNEYKPGQGIMPHQDGPLYFPTVATISLGAHTVLDFYVPFTTEPSDENLESSQRYQFSLLLERRSLLVLKDSMYTLYLHGISENCEDRIHRDQVRNIDNLGDVAMRQNIQKSGCVTKKRDKTRISLTIRHVPKTTKFKLKT